MANDCGNDGVGDGTRIDKILGEGVDLQDPHQNVFFEGPAEFLCKTVVEGLLQVPQFVEIFADNIDPYKRMDYSIRELPAMRVYTNGDSKDYESWFIEGNFQIDIIFPASVRRNELQQVQDTLSAAVVQQFRRPTFFDLIEEKVPGLNELGKRVTSDKSLGFDMEEAIVPLTQLTLNFRLDLREWDKHLEDTLRTKDSPFEQVLGDLKRITTLIQGMKEEMLDYSEQTVDVTIDSEQQV